MNCPRCGWSGQFLDENGQHNFCPTSTPNGRIIDICMGCKMREIKVYKKKGGRFMLTDAGLSLDTIEKVIFVLRGGDLRVADRGEVVHNQIPPNVEEVVLLGSDGTWTNFYPDPLGR